MDLVLILIIIVLILGGLSFWITNAVTHIAKFFVFVVIVAIVALILYAYFSFNPPEAQPPPPDIETPVIPDFSQG